LKQIAFLAALIFISVDARAQVSAASYQSVVAPNSLASLFGSGYTDVTSSAVLDAIGQLPTTLGGVTVVVNGVAAPLLFVSSLQINFLVPDSTDIGAADVIVKNATSGKQFEYTMQVRNVAPALFSRDASGRGPGAILNASTFLLEPFLVETPENAGSDKRTRLALFGTGLRYAGNPLRDPAKVNAAAQIQARDGAGNAYFVEYAGPAPGFFGLDQINLIVPAAADGAGVVSLTVTADNFVSNAVTFTMNSLPANSIHLLGLTLSTTSVTGGNDVVATVFLNGRSRSGGYTVNLTANGLAIGVPNSFTVPEGLAAAGFTVHTAATTTTRSETLTAFASGVSISASLQIVSVNAPHLTGVSLSKNPVKGGEVLTGILSFTGNIPIDGAAFQLASDNVNVQVPPALTLSFPQTLASFPITTAVVTQAESATITASYGDTTAAAILTVRPALTLQLSTSGVTGGTPVAGTITLSDLAPPGGVMVILHSSNPVFASVPGTVVVPGGQSSASFTISTLSVNSSQTVFISAAAAGVTVASTLNIDPANLPALTNLTIAPTIVTGGGSTLATISLSAPAPSSGLVVNLQSDNPFVVQPPAFITVPAKSTTVSVAIQTTKVSSAQVVTIIATAGAVSKRATITVQ
jgi:uncharacterized protein (TIGR03437 family)